MGYQLANAFKAAKAKNGVRRQCDSCDKDAKSTVGDSNPLWLCPECMDSFVVDKRGK